MFTLLITIALTVSAQKTIYDYIKISEEDSSALNNTWVDFYQSIQNKDSSKLKEIALEIVYCPSCVYTDSPLFSRFFIPVDSFMNKAFAEESIFTSYVWNAIKNKKYHMIARRIPDFIPRNFELEEDKQYEDFELFYVTREAGEWGKGHEGQSYYFTFVKINNKFRFSGLGSIP